MSLRGNHHGFEDGEGHQAPITLRNRANLLVIGILTRFGALTAKKPIPAFSDKKGQKGASDFHKFSQKRQTSAAGGQHHAVVAPTIAAYYGNDKDGQAVDEPARTTTTRERFGLVESKAVTPQLTEDQIAGARRVAKFLRSHGIQFEGEFATVAGYVIVDIGLRMLTPRELFRAQGFPDDYIIDRAWVVNPKTGAIQEIRLTKEQQIRMCGNSVCPQVAEALIRANNPEMCIGKVKEKRRTNYQNRAPVQLAA